MSLKGKVALGASLAVAFLSVLAWLLWGETKIRKAEFVTFQVLADRTNAVFKTALPLRSDLPWAFGRSWGDAEWISRSGSVHRADYRRQGIVPGDELSVIARLPNEGRWKIRVTVSGNLFVRMPRKKYWNLPLKRRVVFESDWIDPAEVRTKN